MGHPWVGLDRAGSRVFSLLSKSRRLGRVQLCWSVWVMGHPECYTEISELLVLLMFEFNLGVYCAYTGNAEIKIKSKFSTLLPYFFVQIKHS